MIILSILVLMLGLLCMSLIIHIKNLSCKLTHLQDDVGQLFYKMGMSEGNYGLIKRQIQDVKDEIIGYQFSLRTFEEYVKERLENKP